MSGTLGDTGSTIEVDVPVGGVSEKLDMFYTTWGDAPAPTSGLRYAGTPFTIEGYRGDERLDDYEFDAPGSVSLVVASGDLAGVDVETLGVYRWSGSEWVAHPFDLESTGGDEPPAEQHLVFSTDSAGSVAVIGESSGHMVFLPCLSVTT